MNLFLGENEAFSPKPYSDDDKSGGSRPSNAVSLGGGPKVPSLKIKIIIPSNDGDMSKRLNGNNVHYTAFPYIVPSEESPLASSQPNSPKSLQKATFDTDVEEQKCHQTRVFGLSNRCMSNGNNAPSRGTSPIVPNEQLPQITSPAAVGIDAGSGILSQSATHSEQTENVSAIISEDDKQVTTSAAATVITASDSVATAELSGKELHPRRRKLKSRCNESKTCNSSNANITVGTNPSGTTSEPAPVTNCYQMFLDIRKQVNLLNNNLFDCCFCFNMLVLLLFFFLD